MQGEFKNSLRTGKFIYYATKLSGKKAHSVISHFVKYENGELSGPYCRYLLNFGRKCPKFFLFHLRSFTITSRG